MNAPLLLTFAAYLAVISVLGIRAWRRTTDMGDYVLGGRSLGAAVTALSAGASDMSGWLLLGLPGAVYLAGMSEIWLGVGLVIGAYCNWLWVAKPLRIHSAAAGDSLTLPSFFANRFGARGRQLRVLSAGVILLFFTFYTAAGLVAGAVLFESAFGLDYTVALLAGGLVIVAYTFVGGFLAVAWTDAMQATLMLAALVIAPLLVVSGSGGLAGTWQQLEVVAPDSTNVFAGIGALGLASLLAWGLGYVGQPHILARFMAIKSPAALASARRIAMAWMVVVMSGAVATGLAGMVYFAAVPLDNPETVFIALSQSLFSPWVAGIIVAAILSAIMSTIDSQLLVSSSVVGDDLYRTLLNRPAGDRELVAVSRGAVVVIAALAMVIASDRDSGVLNLVSYAWAGFGAAFGPVVVFSLFWRRMTATAAIAGMSVGAVTVVLWSNGHGGILDLYELLPGFAFASLAIVGIGLGFPEREPAVLARFDAVQQRRRKA